MQRMPKIYNERLVALRAVTIKNLRAFLRNESGATAIIVALTLPALIGGMGLAAEVSYWRLHQRAMQNASDAAAIAAATNGGSSYAAEAKAVAAQYGFQNGAKNITVTVSNTGTAPGCTANCYTVAISDQVQSFLSQVVGYKGTATVNGRSATAIAASAVATSATAYPYCILALAGSGAQGITSNGAPNTNLNGCNVMSNTGATCNGHDLNANFGDAHGTNKGCGVAQNSSAPVVTDPYAGLASNIPADTCRGLYPQEPAKKGDPALPASNKWYGTENVSGYKVVCGDQQLTDNTTIKGGSNGAVLVIENGQLDTNGYTLSGTGLTVVFTGSNNSGYQHIPTGGGTLNIAAPTSGNWSGSQYTRTHISLQTSTFPLPATVHPGTSAASFICRIPALRLAVQSASPVRARVVSNWWLITLRSTAPATYSRTTLNAHLPGLRSHGAGIEDPGELMLMPSIPMLRLFRRDTRGTAAIEFAGSAILLVAGLLNAVDLGYYEYRRMEVEYAAEVGAQIAWSTCSDQSTMLPATQNCPGLNTAITSAIQSTSLGTAVSLASGYPAEGYYCVNSSGALQSVGSLANKPANCSAAGNANVSPGDYIRVGVTFSYAPLFPGVTVMSVWGITSINMTSWMRLG